ncbi:uncharacterized protein K452DRAFT_303502 [Aplosporella prunicola CBS 121167]|uniref:Carboxypeptidase n=1 Tax=Aplosporella prunicola CBS 121167 TaxID=1176127 RepID=A0A6A6AX45_9PEZI|nr:uncharacterized protein K452DRAFT_303502 [Aplosporella prunicola CBS 121167]KAF2135504.1 hypothetical protein K452DRAFT_303502 [Aplosporella prunicola CBS 121167]
MRLSTLALAFSAALASLVSAAPPSFAPASAADADSKPTLPRANVFERADAVKRAFVEKRRAGQPFQNQRLQRRASAYLNDKSQKFVVNGSALPEVDFDIGESYAGLLPISGDKNETRELFFWFFPSTNPLAKDELAIWLNGGPGCSSLSGLLTENGPFTWMSGTLAPTQNPYTWVNLTNMLWVEQPVGVGFSKGTPDITDELGMAKEFLGFYKQFVDTFELHGNKVYVTGESYAGYYVPYIADAMIQANDKDYYNLAGIAINDPIIGDDILQQEVVIAPYVHYWKNLFNLNDTFLEEMDKRADSFNFTTYLDNYLTFPPPQEPFPNIKGSMFEYVYSAALDINPCFNIYHITDTCPHLYSVMGIVNQGDYSPPGQEVYFAREDVQAAINAPIIGKAWEQCSSRSVFPGGDQSLGPAVDGTLQRVIEHTNNTIVGVGDLDFILPTNGSLLALQNTTWNGLQGLQEFPSKPFFVPFHPEYNGGSLSEAGTVGRWGAERGLTFYSVQLAGHELPGYTPGAGYRSIELLLGRIKDLSSDEPFSTQKNVVSEASGNERP